MDSAAGTTSSGRGVASGAVKKASAVMSSMRASLFCRLANTSSVLASACSVIVAGLAVGGADTAGATGATSATGAMAGPITAGGSKGLGLWRVAGFSSFAGTGFAGAGFIGAGVKDCAMGNGWMR